MGIRRAVAELIVVLAVLTASGCGDDRGSADSGAGLEPSGRRDVVAFTASLDDSVPERGLADPPLDSDDYWVELGDRYCRSLVSQLKGGGAGDTMSVLSAMDVSETENAQIIAINADARDYLCPDAEDTEALPQTTEVNEERSEVAVELVVNGIGRPGAATVDGFDQSCVGTRQFPDLRERATASVLDEKGTEVGSGSMKTAQLAPGGCSFMFWVFVSLEETGDTGDLFTFTAGQREPMTFTRDQMVEQYGGVYYDVRLELE